MATKPASSTRRANGIFAAVVVVAALAIAIAWFLVRPPVASTATSPAVSGEVEEARGGRPTLVDESAQRGSTDTFVPPDAREPEDKRESAARPAPQPVPAPAPALRRAEIDLRLFFVTPKGEKLVVPHATITLALEDGTKRVMDVANDSGATIRPLPPGKCEVSVAANALWQRPLVIPLVADTGVHSDDADVGSMTIREQKVVLWPDGWIAVVVRTRDGRPLRALADDLRLETKRLFYGAFDVRARLSPPGAEARDEKEPVATFRPPSTYPYPELPDGAVGSLQLLHEPPLWAGLSVLGVPLAWELVHPGDREVVFELDQAAFDERCATVRLRVLDARSRSALPDARVTLRADTAPHRRADQENVAPRGDGSVELKRTLPGKYELTVTRGNDLDQRRLDLAPGQVLDVGDVLLEQNGSIALVVVDEKGEPVSAYIEIAPLEPGKDVAALYPPMLHRRTDRHGRYDLPLPSKRSIVRARIEGGTSAGQPASGARTANVLLDPRELPPQPWKLVVRETVGVTFECASDVVLVEAVDELGVIDAWPKPDAQRKAACKLVPGRYRARFVGAEKEARGEVAFTLGVESSTVRGP